MEYRIRFKRIEAGDGPDEDYQTLGGGLQYQGVGRKIPIDVTLSIGVLVGKLTAGHEQEMVVPKGKVLEVIFKDE